jgi:hypothetical protein
MLKIVCTFLSVLIFSSAFSQISRGSVLVGVNFSIAKTEFENSGSKWEQKSVVISPSIATAIRDNLVLGIDVMSTGAEYENESASYMNESKQLGGGLFLKQYKSIATSFMVFLQGRVGYAKIDNEYGSISNPASRSVTEGSNVSLGFVPGVSYKAGKSILVEVGINSLLNISMENTETTSPSFSGSEVTKNKSFEVSSLGGVSPLTVGVKFVF